jgi:hypothetical protein
VGLKNFSKSEQFSTKKKHSRKFNDSGAADVGRLKAFLACCVSCSKNGITLASLMTKLKQTKTLGHKQRGGFGSK